MALQVLGKCAETAIEGYRVIPKGRMSGVGHHVDLRVRHAGFVPINDRRFEYRVVSAMRDQDRLAYFRQKIVVIDDARKECLPNVRRHGDVVAQHQIEVVGRELSREQHAYEALEIVHALLRIYGK